MPRPVQPQRALRADGNPLALPVSSLFAVYGIFIAPIGWEFAGLGGGQRRGEDVGVPDLAEVELSGEAPGPKAIHASSIHPVGTRSGLILFAP